MIYGKVMFRKEPEGRYKCLQYGTICSNAGFLGNPIAEGIYGAEGLVLASVYLIPQRIMMWSSGLAVFSGSSDKMKTLKKSRNPSVYSGMRFRNYSDGYRTSTASWT